MEENTLRKTLIARINNFLPAHKHDYCEKRFQNSSIKEMQNAIGRNRHVQMARSQQSRLLKDFKESQNGAYEEVLDKSKFINLGWAVLPLVKHILGIEWWMKLMICLFGRSWEYWEGTRCSGR